MTLTYGERVKLDCSGLQCCKYALYLCILVSWGKKQAAPKEQPLVVVRVTGAKERFRERCQVMEPQCFLNVALVPDILFVLSAQDVTQSSFPHQSPTMEIFSIDGAITAPPSSFKDGTLSQSVRPNSSHSTKWQAIGEAETGEQSFCRHEPEISKHSRHSTRTPRSLSTRNKKIFRRQRTAAEREGNVPCAQDAKSSQICSIRPA